MFHSCILSDPQLEHRILHSCSWAGLKHLTQKLAVGSGISNLTTTLFTRAVVKTSFSGESQLMKKNEKETFGGPALTDTGSLIEDLI